MNPSEHSKQEQPKKAKFMPLWLAYLLAILVWAVLPWTISLLTPRIGWLAGRPGLWNLLGWIPVVLGAIGLFWGMASHASESAEGIEWEMDKSYLLQRGMYARSRHPMYVSELILMLGWIIFFGSIALVVAWLVWFLFFNFYAIPNEERILEQHFGDAYREYKRNVPRWLGRSRQ